ncbi:uncharacterized protein [Ptychodera flava]|uniref:uncharacterized protein n=1 Tax=Ptychodera flava TaxID=63121 RepID=UPI00396A5DE9
MTLSNLPFGRRQEPATIFNPGRQDGDGEVFGRQPMIGLRMSFKHRIVFAVNVGQILASLPCIIAGSFAIVMECSLAKLGVPVWCGLLFLAAGMQGVIAARKKNTLMVLMALILSVVSTAGSIAVVIVAVYALFRDSTYQNCYMYPEECVPAGCVVGGLIVLVAGIAECACAVITVTLCSQAVCRCRSPTYRSGRPYIVLDNSEPQPLLSGVQNTPTMAGTIVVDPGGQTPSNGRVQTSSVNSTAVHSRPATLSPSSLPVHSQGTGTWLTAAKHSGRGRDGQAAGSSRSRQVKVNEGFEAEEEAPDRRTEATNSVTLYNIIGSDDNQISDSAC